MNNCVYNWTGDRKTVRFATANAVKSVTAHEVINTNVSFDRNRQMQETVSQISRTSISTQNIRPSINLGGNTFNITCPGVSSQAVMREVKTALNREFNGLHNFADQWVRR